jgi:hypothetical protein
VVKPGQAHLGLGSRPATDDEAGVAGKGHQEVAGIAHPAGDEDGAWPVGQVDLIVGNDADHLTPGRHRPLGGVAGDRTTAATDHGEPDPGEVRDGLTGKVVGAGAGLGAPEDTDLGWSAFEGSHGKGQSITRPPIPPCTAGSNSTQLAAAGQPRSGEAHASQA